MGVLYMLTFPNGKKYVGVTTKTAEERFARHSINADMNKIQYALYKAWRKHGPPALEVLAIVEDKILLDVEIRAIATYKTILPHGYNSTYGGQGGVTPEGAKKISKALLGHKKSPATIEKQRQKMLGKAPPNKGKPMSEEQKEKLRAAAIRQFSDPAMREAARQKSMGNTNRRGYKMTPEELAEHTRRHAVKSPEARAKLSAAASGKTHSEETKQKMREAQKKRWATYGRRGEKALTQQSN